MSLVRRRRFRPSLLFARHIFHSWIKRDSYLLFVITSDVIRALPRLDDPAVASQRVQVTIGDENVFINRLLLSIEKILNRGLRGTGSALFILLQLSS
jgi:hypothetical protein